MDELVFKMAAWDVVENSQAYRSDKCSHDLYFTGFDWKDIPEGGTDQPHATECS